jgi:hypothetical protein
MLQAVIEMQKSIGELTARTDRLISDVKSQGDKVDGIRLLLAWFGGGSALLGGTCRYWPSAPEALALDWYRLKMTPPSRCSPLLCLTST